MNRTVFVNRYFYPDHSATSRLLSDLAFELAQRGFSVQVISSRLRYDDVGKPLPAAETIRGVKVSRVAGTRFGRRSLILRAVDYATFLVATGWRLLRTIRRNDVVVFKTDPPMLGPLLAPLVRLRGARVINWLQDLFPQVAVEAGVLGPRAGGLLAAYCQRELRKADLCVCVGQTMREKLAAMGVNGQVIDNWCDTGALRASPQAVAELREQWQLSGRFVIAYSGNLGRAHPVAALQEAISRLANDPRIVFLFTGGGAGYESLRQWCVAQGHEGVIFKPYQPEERLPALLALGHLHLVILAPRYEGLIVPSKFSGLAAAGRPCLFIGSADGQIGRWIEQANCGLSVGDGAQLADAVVQLIDEPAMLDEMGQRGRQLAVEVFDRALAMQRWQGILGSLVAQPAAAGESAGD